MCVNAHTAILSSRVLVRSVCAAQWDDYLCDRLWAILRVCRSRRCIKVVPREKLARPKQNSPRYSCSCKHYPSRSRLNLLTAGRMSGMYDPLWVSCADSRGPISQRKIRRRALFGDEETGSRDWRHVQISRGHCKHSGQSKDSVLQ